MLWNDSFVYPFGSVASTVTSSYLPQAEGFLVLCPFTNLSHMYYDPNPSSLASLYNAVFFNGSGATLTISPETEDFSFFWPNLLSLAWGSGAKWHGSSAPIFYAPDDDITGYVWLQKGDTLGFTFSNATYGNYIVAYTANGLNVAKPEFTLGTSLAPVYTANVVAGADGFYGVGWNFTTDPIGMTMKVITVTTAGRLRMVPANTRVVAVQAVLGRSRVIGHSMLCHNTSPAQWAGGSIAQKQLPVGQHWTDVWPAPTTVLSGGYASTGVYSIINDMVDADRDRDAKLGSYVWHKPADPKWSEWSTEFENSDSVYAYSVPIIPNGGSFVVVSLNIPVATGTFAGAGSGQNFRVSVDTYVEATTDDQSRPTGFPVGDPVAFEHAQMKFRSLPQYCENPTHLAELMSAIRGGVRNASEFALKHGPTALKWAKVISALA